MLTAHPKVKVLANNPEPSQQKLWVPVWMSMESTWDKSQQEADRLKKQKKKKTLTYNAPPPRKERKTTDDFISNIVRRPLHPEVFAKRKDISKELLPGTEFSYLKFTPVFRPHRLPTMQKSICPFLLEPYGRFVFANGDKYEGQYAIDPGNGPRRYGIGKYVKTNGSVFMGHWYADKLSGPKCFVILPTEMAKYKGEMKDGKFHGYGVYRGPDGLCQGQFKKGRFTGKNKLIDCDGFTWIGNFHCSAAFGLTLDLEMVHDIKILPIAAPVSPKM